MIIPATGEPVLLPDDTYTPPDDDDRDDDEEEPPQLLRLLPLLRLELDVELRLL